MKKILAVLVTLTILASLFAPIVVNAAEAETDLVFEIGEISYNSDSGEIAVPILLAENYSNIYSARIVFLNEQGLECTNVVGGDLTQYYYTEYGEKIVIAPTYSVNPKGNMLIIREKSGYGFSETGCVGTFYFAADESFSEADLYNYTFYFGEATTITSAEGNALSFELKGKETADCEHWNIYEEIVIEPTYESDGIKHIICADCGMVNKEIIPALQVPVEPGPAVCYHFACFEEVVIAPTYESEGIIRTICSDCYEVLSEETVPALPSPVEPDVCEHGETVEHIVKEANCIEEGIKEIVCVYCKEVVLTEIIMPSEHIFEPAPEKDQAPTCTEPGYTAYMCYSCGEMMTEEVPPTKHVKTYEEIVREPDIGVEGLKNIVCAICREVVATETIPAIDDTVEPRPEEPPVVEPVDAQLVFEIGDITYNSALREIEVSLYLAENYTDLYTGRIELYSEQGLMCTMAEPGDIKDHYYIDGKKVEFGLYYDIDPYQNLVLLNSTSDSSGVTSTGYIAKYYFAVDGVYSDADLEKFTFYFGGETNFTSIDGYAPSFELRNKQTEECAHLNTYEEILIAPTLESEGLKHIICSDCYEVVAEEIIPAIETPVEPEPEDPPVVEPVDAQLIFEIGKVTYNAQYGEIEVPIYLSENYKDIYAGEIELYSEQGLECSAILNGTIKDTYESYASNGRVEIVEYGFNYTPNPKLSRLIIDSSSGDHGVTSTGLIATFCYKVNDDFTAESINEYTFVFSENTMFVAIDLSKPSFVLTKSATEECAHLNTEEIFETAPTCSAGGVSNIVCVDCGSIVGKNLLAPTGHDFIPSPENSKEPTCTTAGYVAYVCVVCGEIKTEGMVSLGHNKTYEEIVREPAIGVEGLKNIICGICGEVVRTETIPAIETPVEPEPEDPPVVEPVDAQLIFEIGKVTYNAQYGEIEVPLYLAENHKDIYAGEIELYSEQGLECTAIIEGTIKDEIDKGGRVGIVEFGFSYTPNPELSRVIIDSAEPTSGITTTGLVATFCYKVNDDFTAESINEYTFVLSSETLFVAFDLSNPSYELRERTAEECAHRILEEIVEIEPTCSAEGIAKVVCVDCGTVIETLYLPVTEHGFVPMPEKSVAPTCTESGYNVYMCNGCGEMKTEETPALGHNKTYEEIVREPAIGVEGLKNIICGICGEIVRTETIPALENPVEPEPEDPPVVEPVDAQLIFEIGKVTYNAQYGEIEVPLYLAENHKDIYAGEIELYSEQGLECTAIIEGTIKDEIDKGGRVGIVEFGFSYTLNPQLGRVIIDSAEPTSGITTTGLVATFCYKVNDDFTAESINEYTFVLSSETLFVAFDLSNPTYALRERVIEECEHVNVNEVLLIAPTCTAEGVMNIVCADCGEVVSKKTIPIINHMYKTVADKYIEPTCTLEGREVSRCINCGDEVIQTLPPLGHGETIEVVVKEPAVGVEGLKEIRCSVCGEVLETIILPALENPEPPVETDVIFELGRLVYNEEYGEIEVPLYVVENNKDIYTAQVVLLSQQGLECTSILSGTIKDYFDKGGREGVVEYGFSYTVNPTKNFLLIDSTEVTRGITSTGLLATFCFKAPENFKITDLAEFEFDLGDNMIIAFDGTYLNEELRETYYCYHFETEEVIVKAATCTENGLKNIVCSACAEVISSVEIEATGHNFEHYAEGDVAPTCTEAGKVAYKCHCSEMKYEVGAPAKGHTYKLNDGLTCVDCKHSKKPAKVEVVEVTSDSVTLAEKTYLEYSIDGVNWQSSCVFEGLEAETEYTFYSRVAASNVADVSEASEGVTVTTEAEYAPGDINGDGGVNAADLRLLKMLIAQQIPLDHPDVKNTEVDNISGMPNASDLRVIKLLIAQLY